MRTRLSCSAKGSNPEEVEGTTVTQLSTQTRKSGPSWDPLQTRQSVVIMLDARKIGVKGDSQDYRPCVVQS